MNTLNYYSHILLYSKYRLFIHFIIIFFIYLTMYGSKVVYCMNENNNISDIPRPNRSIPDIIRNIQAFAGSRASLNEEKDAIILNKMEEIAGLQADNERMTETIHRNEYQINRLQERNAELNRSLDAFTFNTDIADTKEEIETKRPTFNESDPALIDFKQHDVFPVPILSEEFSLNSSTNFQLYDGRIIQQSESYLRTTSSFLQNESTRIETYDGVYEDVQGFFIKREHTMAQAQTTYYPPNHYLNGFKPAGDIEQSGKIILKRKDLIPGYTCACGCCLFTCIPFCNIK